MRFAVRVKPGAKRTLVGGRWDGPGGPALLVAVTARAVDGRANAAVTVALADAFAVPGRAVRIVGGLRSRLKLIDIDDTGDTGDAEAASRRCLDRLLGP